MNVHIANAPCSWGALEFDLDGSSPGYLQVLQEMAQAGYQGTELGDWGFMPTDPAQLQAALQKESLDLLGAFVPVAFADPSKHQDGVEAALRVAGLMYDAGYPHAFIVLADENGSVPLRTLHAGRVEHSMGLTDYQWAIFAEGVTRVAQAVKDRYSMRCVFHHHCGGYVETPSELTELMNRTSPDLVGLCFDTGHYAFGGGDPLTGLTKWRDRIWHVHFKDFDAAIGNKAAENQWDYFTSVQNGVFCELGKGSVDFDAVKTHLEETAYSGWIVVEQDVLPGMGSPLSCAINNRNYLKTLHL